MRKILMLVVMVVMAVVAMAQSTNKISYQAVVRDGQNRLVTNSDVTVLVKIGTTYQETFSVTTNANGLLSLQIPTDAHQTDFDAINWATANTITTTVTIVSTSESMTNTVPVTSVPYALYANNVNPAVFDVIYDKIQADSVVLQDSIASLANNVYTKAEADALLGAKADTSALNALTNNVYTKAQSDSLLAGKADTSALNALTNNVYTKAQSDSLLAGKADTSALNALTNNVYTKAQSDSLLAGKADTSALNALTNNVYTKAQSDSLLAGKADTSALNALTNNVYTKAESDSLLAAKADTSDIHDAPVFVYKPDHTVLTNFTLNTVDTQKIYLPGNTMTVYFVNDGDTVLGYNAFGDPDPDMAIDISGITTKAIVKYINTTRADADVNDVDSIYNALRTAAHGDVKEEIMRKVKEVAMNHEQDAIDILLYYFENVSTTQMRNVLNEVTADTALVVRNFLTKLNSVLTPNDVKVIIRALSQSITEAQVENVIDALNRYVTPAQVDHFIDALDAAAATPGSAAARLKQRLTNYIDARIDAKINQHNSDPAAHH